MKKADGNSYLNQDSLRELYPKLPRETAERLRFTRLYANNKEEPKVKKTLFLALVMSLMAVMLAAAAIAEISTGVISNYLNKSKGVALTEEGEKLFARAEAVATHEFEDVIFTITQAATDGRSLFVGAVIRPKPGREVLLAIGETGRGDIVPYGEKGETYKEMAQRTGKRIVTATLGYSFNNQMTAMIGDDYDKDGTMYLLLTADIRGHEEFAEVMLSMEAAAYDLEKERADNIQTYEQAVKLTSYTPEVKELAVDRDIPGLGIRVESMTLSLTPISLYFDIRMQGGEEMASLEFYDEKDRRIEGGAAGMGFSGKEGETYIQNGSLNLTDFPKELFLKVFDYGSAAYSEALRVEIP